jgi:hypothetical protein
LQFENFKMANFEAIFLAVATVEKFGTATKN